MIVRIIGCDGGVSPAGKATSYLIDDELLIDAGSVAEGISLEEQARLGAILISHAHLDHIKDLAFLCDNCLGIRERPFEVYCNHYVREAILRHLFNDVIWPDFSRLPSPQAPIIRFHTIGQEQALLLGQYKITPVEVNHPGNALGFVVEKEAASLLFTQDTGPTQRIWQVAREQTNLKAIFTEASFPNHLAQLAARSHHHTPHSLAEEIPKMPADIPIYLGHFKPNFYAKLQREIQQIGLSRIHLLGRHGKSYQF